MVNLSNLSNIIINPNPTPNPNGNGSNGDSHLSLPPQLRASNGPFPRDFGIAGYEEYTTPQAEALNHVLSLMNRNYMFCLPTGVGKTLLSVSIGKALHQRYNLRTLILTCTNQLQEQLEKKHPDIPIVKGRSNYTCPTHGDCERGGRFGCSRRAAGCEADEARDTAAMAPVVSTNYVYWITVNRYLHNMHPIGKFACIIMDEVHLLPNTLTGNLTVTLNMTESVHPGIPADLESIVMANWPDLNHSPKPRQRIDQNAIDANVALLQAWAEGHRSTVNSKLQALTTTFERDRKTMSHNAADKLALQIKHTEEFAGDLYLLKTMKPGEWVVDNPNPEVLKPGVPPVVKAAPIRAFRYAHYVTPLDTGLRLMMSGTTNPIIARELGIGREDMLFLDWPQVFPAERNPIYCTDTLDIRYETENLPTTQAQIRAMFVEILGDIHRHHKCLVHTVSYTRMDQWVRLLQDTQLAKRIIAHKRDRYGRYESLPQVLDRYLKADYPAVLFSPVAHTGVDLVGNACRCIIVPKVPHQPSQELLTKVRRQVMPDLVDYDVLVNIIQSARRGSRGYNDWCITYIAAKDMYPFWKRTRINAPASFCPAFVHRIPREAPWKAYVDDSFRWPKPERSS